MFFVYLCMFFQLILLEILQYNSDDYLKAHYFSKDNYSTIAINKLIMSHNLFLI